MPDDDDPIAHGHDAAVQVVTVLAAMAGELTRRSALRMQSRSDDLERQEARDRAVQAAERARDAVRWSPMLDRDFRTVATTSEALAAWNAAGRWVESDPLAARASRLAETVLRRTDPQVMVVFDAARNRGFDHRAAMRSAVETMRRPRDHGASVGIGGLASVMTARAGGTSLAATRLKPSREDASAPVLDANAGGPDQPAGSEERPPSQTAAASRPTLDARPRAAVSVDFPVLITTVPMRATPASPGAVPPPTVTLTATKAERPRPPR